MEDQKPITIFYSWQSDSDKDCNFKAIKNAIRHASVDIENEIKNIRLIMDEATRDTAGSPDIPSTIFQKIANCDIFICDVTTINFEIQNIPRKTPNPNVLIELGFAIALLGWERIIMLFNKSFGEFPNDIPFDISRRRISSYSVSSGDDSNGKGLLRTLLKSAIKKIIEKNPLRQNELEKLSPEEKKRRSDITNLKWILSSIHIPTLDVFLAEAPEMLFGKILHFWESFNGIKNSRLFHIYDSKANELLGQVYENWRKSLSYGHCYRSVPNSQYYIFGHSDPQYLTEQDDNDFKDILKHIEALRTSSTLLFNYIRENFLEIDLNETSKAAFDEYREFNKEIPRSKI